MKTKTMIIVNFLIILLSSVLLPSYSQDILNPPKIKPLTDTSVYDRDWNKNHFIIGWNWGQIGRKIDDALNINYYHDFFSFDWSTQVGYTSANYFVPNHRKVTDLLELTHDRRDQTYLNAQSMMYFPTIEVDSIDRDFHPREHDTYGAVFGFKTKRLGLIPTQSSDVNYDYFLLYKDSLHTDSVVVLEDVYQSDALRYLNFGVKGQMMDDFYKNCTWMYITINIRQLQVIPDSMLSKPVIKIKCPYNLSRLSDPDYSETGYIQFDSLSTRTDTSAIQDIVSSLEQNRGKYRMLTKLQSPTNEFIITGAMINQQSNELNASITLSAFFYLDNSIRNYILMPADINDQRFRASSCISKLDCEVTYYGNVDIGIKYIRFETPQARNMYFGVFDSVVSNRLTRMEDTIRGNPARAKVNRIYGIDEIWPAEYGATRYYNFLMDTLVTTETFINLTPKIALYATGMKEFWNGSTTGFNLGNYAPYYYRVRRTYSDPTGMSWAAPDIHTLYHAGGYAGQKYYLPNGDTTISQGAYFTEHQILNSHYELAPSNECLQEHIDGTLESGYYANPDMLFGSKPWWANIWTQPGRWGNNDSIDGKKTAMIYNWYSGVGRPLTGEERMFSLFEPIILGAKGLFYWHKISDFPGGFEAGLIPAEYRDSTLPAGNLIDLVYSETLGGDYIRFNDTNSLFRQLRRDLLDVTTMGVNTNHIYIGIRSNRVEIYKVNKWVRANEETLMKLRLQAWLGKGHDSSYAQGSQITSDTMMKQYIDIWNIKTRPIGRDANGNPYYEQSSIDSGFYDITILKDTTSPNDAGIYLGVQNRRTDPLIYDSVSNKMIFTPTAEFDQHVQSGRDTALWQSRWWKRQGAREIRIPFNIEREPEDSYSGDYIIAKELGAEDTTLRNTSFWLNEKYHDWIDTVIKGNGSLVSNYLPGEGKMIKLDFHNLAESSSAGDTCTGCYWASQHISIEKTARTDSNGQYCWDIIIHNSSDCDYDSLNILLLSNKNNIDSMTFSDWGWISSDSSLAYFKGSVLSGDSSIIHICAPDNETFSYSIWIGAEVGGEIVKCDEALTDTIYENRCCDSVAYLISEDTSDCPCGKHSLRVHGSFSRTTCFDSLQIGVTNIKNNDTTFKQFGNFRFDTANNSTNFSIDFCVDGGKNKIVANLFDDGEIKCSHTYEKIYISPCEYIEITEIIADRCLGCPPPPLFFKVKNSSPCDLVFFVDKSDDSTHLHPETVVSQRTIQSGSDDMAVFNVPVGCYQYHFFFTIGDSTQCDTTFTRCGESWTPPNPCPMCPIASVIIQRNLQSWSAELKAKCDSPGVYIYKIEVIDPRYPNVPLFSETRNPANDPPFNLYPNELSIFTQNALLDSTIVFNALFFTSSDTLPLTTMHFDSTIYGPMIYISNLQANPNPVNNSLNISYHVLAPVDVNVSVWDNFGIKIYDFGTSWHTVGDYNLNLDISQYINGSYHVITTARGDIQNLPFIINR